MRNTRLLVCFLAVSVMRCGAQSAGNWSNLQHLPPNESIRVHARHRIVSCEFKAADETVLTCVRRRDSIFGPRERRFSFARADVLTVKASRTVASTLLGGAIGVGAGVGIGAGVSAAENYSKEDGYLFPFFLGLLGGSFGAGLGHGTDFLAGPVIYRAP